jgi:hypothetical protein
MNLGTLVRWILTTGCCATSSLWPRNATSPGRRSGCTSRDIALDLSHHAVADGAAIAIVGRSSAARLPSDLRWIPLTEPVAVTVALVLPAAEQTATAQRFEQVALAHADAHGWLA